MRVGSVHEAMEYVPTEACGRLASGVRDGCLVDEPLVLWQVDGLSKGNMSPKHHWLRPSSLDIEAYLLRVYSHL